MTGWWATIPQAAAFYQRSQQRMRIIADRAEKTGTAWRGQYFKTRWTHGRGGLGGLVREVWIDEPENAGDELTTSPTALEAPSKRLCDRQSKTQWVLALIKPVLAHPKGSRERGKAIDAAADTRVTVNGKHLRLGRRQITRYLAKLEREGIAGLMRPERSDKGRRRYYVSRDFHREMRRRLSDEQLAYIDGALRTYFRQLVRAGETASLRPLHMAERLAILVKGEGIDLSPADKARICRVPSSFMREEVSRWRNVNLAETDAKGYADRRLPRIARRSDDLWPNEWIIADCTKFNFYVERPDGTLTTLWVVIFFDVATHRAHITLYLLPKGKGISQALVIKAFLRMVTAWGLPVNLYVDNGSEFGWTEMVADITALSVLPYGEHAPRRVNAQPYNAAAKGLIEGFIAVFERLLAGHTHYVGGNRMAKKTANLGKAPVPVRGGLETVQEWTYTDLSLYHNNPQGPGGMLRGRSPNQALEDAHRAGWRPCAVNADDLQLAFSTRERRKLRQATFLFEGKRYTCPELDECHDDYVNFLAPKCLDWEWPGLPLLDGDGKPFGLARMIEPYAYGDIEGAKAASQRKAANRRSLRDLGKTIPHLDLAAERQRLAETLGPAPTIEPGSRVTPSPEGAEVIKFVQKPQPGNPEDELDEASRALLRRLAAFED